MEDVLRKGYLAHCKSPFNLCTVRARAWVSMLAINYTHLEGDGVCQGFTVSLVLFINFKNRISGAERFNYFRISIPAFYRSHALFGFELLFRFPIKM